MAWLAKKTGYHNGYLHKLVTTTVNKKPSQEVIERCAAVLGGPDAASVADALRHVAFPDPGPPTPEPPSTVPAQVPSPRPSLIGAPLQRLETHPSLHSLLLDGGPGVGKSAWARYWAHRIRVHYPEGQLHADLGEQSPNQVLTGWLQALGLSDDIMPRSLSGLVALWRSVSSHRTMLVVIDGALDTEQVRSLLPAGVTNAVIVTSRKRLASLRADTGAAHVTLGPLSASESRELLRDALPQHPVTQDESVLDRIAELCGHLPLALHAAADRLLIQPRPQVLIDDLINDPLQALRTNDWSRSVQEVLYDYVDSLRDTGGRRHLAALRMLAHYPDVTTPGPAAALLNTTEHDALRLADELVAHHVLTLDASGHYRLSRLMAWAVRDRTKTFTDDLHEAGVRWCSWWLQCARQAANHLDHSTEQPAWSTIAAPTEGIELPRIDCQQQAWEWCSLHAAELLTVITHARRLGLAAEGFIAALIPYLMQTNQTQLSHEALMASLTSSAQGRSRQAA